LVGCGRGFELVGAAKKIGAGGMVGVELGCIFREAEEQV
jgi:hypothetical protein